VIVLRLRGLHQFARQEIVESRQAACLRMTPRIALHRCEPLRRKLQRRNVHKQTRVDQYVWRASKDLAPPAIGIKSTMDETIAEFGGRFRLFVADRAKVIACHVKALAIELTHPTFNRDFPIRVPIEKAADNAEADWLADGRRRRKLRRRKSTSDQPA